MDIYVTIKQILVVLLLLDSGYGFRIDTATEKAVSEKYNDDGEGYKARVAGGHPAYIADFPYVAHIFPTNCAGTIIGVKWILTVYTCSDNAHTVALGVDTIKDLTKGEYSVSRSYRQEHYSQKYLISVIELTSELIFNERIQAVSIGTTMDIKNTQVGVVAAFGITSRTDHRKNADYLQSLELPIIGHDTCVDNFFLYSTYLSENPDLDFCAGQNYEEAAPQDIPTINYETLCEGDIGAGLVVGRRIIGVAYNTKGCGYPGKPAIFISVGFAHAWLHGLLKDNISYSDRSARVLSICPISKP